ncbi:Competence protein ComEC [Rubrivivax sp. A210]|uniref:DNA internalization-related competence protein ComEC/Rec2 n=1 Tax=Rubrivivax sp. A210 TaxID=2772301 RepID=UPI001917FF07|nr:DNA internalization-related competence protein ComEC/Rec2 [Rubrivivax sp. A210]CAD5374597.1 Competence protein ComEC [Rubrivivax sp. A210]
MERRAALCGLVAALGWLAGTALQLQLPALWQPLPLLALGAAAGVAVLPALRLCPRLPALLALALACAALAFVATSGRAALRLADVLDPSLEGQDLIVTGIVDDLPQTGLDGTRFVFATESASWRGRPVAVPARLALGWYRGPDEDALLGGPPEEVRAGQRWRLPLRLRQPHGHLNPHGFDLELWLFERGLRASGQVRSRAGEPALLLAAVAGRPLQRARQAARDAIQMQVADPRAAGVLAALAIGDQAAIGRADWDLFRTTGVAHLMSISGLHVTMFAWLAGLLIARLWRLGRRLPLACPAQQAARWGGLAAAAAYALLAGWGVPAQRTVCMLALVALLRGGARRWPLPAVLLAAALAVALLDPWALLQAGFWLSFVAVGLLAASEPVQPALVDAPAGWWPRARRALREGLRSQAVATVGLAPLSLVFFQQLSLVGFGANLVAIPLVTLLIAPLSLLGLLMAPLWQLAAALVQGLAWLLQGLAGLPWAQWQAAVAPPWAVACGLLAGLLAVAPLPWRLRLLALPLMLPLVAPPLQRPAPGRFELVAADIGQGTAVLLRTANHLLVYDSGPQYARESDAGGRVLVPLLRARGEPRIALLVLSHRDLDHVGGAAALLAALPVAALSTSLEDGHPLRASGPPHTRCLAGQVWNWDGVNFQVLHPRPEDYDSAAKPNALSCVLHVQGADRSVLLTGDIEAPQEAALLRRSPEALPADVLLVPHHGSRTSSTADFIAAVAPRLALVQAAYRSRYGHPAPAVLARYAAQGVAVQRSDLCGAWTQPADGPPSAAFCERERARRYWHHPGRFTP